MLMSVPSPPIDFFQRHKSLDVLRGFALMGIFAANIYIFDVDGFGEVKESFEALSYGAADVPFAVFTLIFILNKMMALFSMLFGAGILLLADRIERRGASPSRIHYARNAILACFGLLHGMLWFGDVLLIYAICAFILFPIRRWQSSRLLAAGSITWLAVLGVSFWPGAFGMMLDYVLRALAMMIFGMVLYQSGILTLQRAVSWYRTRSRQLLAVGLPLCAVSWLFYEVNEPVAKLIHNCGVPVVALGYVCFIMTILGQGKLSASLDRLSAAGQMALTNYLLQTALGTLLVSALNEGRGERVTVFWMMLVTFTVWGLQLAWSEPWLRRFHYGPVEWLWRSLAYRRFQPFKS